MCDWSFIFNGVSAAATFGTMIAAFSALNNWKQQKNWELAEDVVVQIKSMEQLIRYVRMPFSPPNESGNENLYFLPIKRMMDSQFDMHRFSEIGIRADFHFEGVGKKFKDMENIIAQIKQATSDLELHIALQGNKQASPLNNKDVQKNQAIIWQKNNENDFIFAECKKIVEDVESLMRPHLRAGKKRNIP